MEQNDTVDEAVDAATTASEPHASSAAAAAGSTPSPSAASAGEKQPQAPVLPPKERRAHARAQKAAKRPARGTRSPEQRQEDRVAERRGKAVARRRRRLSERAEAQQSAPEVEPTPPRDHVAGFQKTRQGVVVSDKADKTITVRIDVARRHRRYSKIVRTSSSLHVHDESNDAHTGDTVIVRESRPLSRTKRWRLVDVVQRAK